MEVINMLPVLHKKSLEKYSKNAEFWIQSVTSSMQANQLKTCTPDEFARAVMEVEELFGSLDGDILEIFELRLRCNPLTASHEVFPILKLDTLMQFLTKERVINGYRFAVIDECDEFEMFGRSQPVTYKEAKTKSGSYHGAFLELDFNGFYQNYFMSEVELFAAEKNWQTQVTNNASAFASFEEFCSFSVLLRAIKGFISVAGFAEHPWLPQLSSNLVVFYEEYFHEYKEGMKNRFADSVFIGSGVSSEGSMVEKALQEMDLYDAAIPDNIVPIVSTDSDELVADDFSNVDFGVI